MSIHNAVLFAKYDRRLASLLVSFMAILDELKYSSSAGCSILNKFLPT